MATKPATTGAVVKNRPVAVSAAAMNALGPQIVWTALPNGITGTGDQRRLKLSIFVSPRLRSGEDDIKDSLSKYPDFIDWPAKVRGLQFAVAFDGGPTVDATKVSADPESELWKALFKSAAPVKTYQLGDFHERPILSYPVSYVQSFIRSKYLSVAATPAMVAQLPRLEDLAHYDMFGQIAFKPHPEYVAAAELRGVVAPPVNLEAQLKQELGQTLKTQRVIPARAAPEPQKDFAQYLMFAEPMVTKKFGVTPPELDFHKALSALGKYPQLMRKLGLVVDIEIPWKGDIPAGAASSTAKIVPKWGATPHGSGQQSVRTKYILNDKTFAAAPRSSASDIQGGMLKLNDPRFEVVQVDVESAAEKSLEFANNLTAEIGPVARAGKRETGGLPTLRSAGLSVIRKERDKKMLEHLKLAAQNNQMLVANMNIAKADGAGGGAQAEPDPIQYVDDLARGLRVDVWDSNTKGWHSLCRRIGQFEFLDSTSPPLQIEEEGFVSSVVAQPPGKVTKETDVRLHEALFRWNGWSLCAMRPGKTIGVDDKPADVENTPGPDFRLKTSFTAVPGSLPRLRFGTTYRLRARAVDLAGNSLRYDEPDPADFSTATIPTVYSRFEPVPSPTLVLRKDVKGQVGTTSVPARPTASGRKAVKPVDTQIEWVSPGESVERLVIRSFNDSPPKDSQPTTQQTERHVVPPKSAQQLGETHGMFDGPTGMKDKMFDSSSGKKDSYTTILENDASLKEVEPAEQLALPYLPDPISVGASLSGLPGATEVTKVDFYTDLTWPEAKPFRIRIVEGTGSPQWDAGKRLLTVLVPKAEIVTFYVSSVIPEKWLEPMGMWNWLEEAAGLRPSAATITAPAPKEKPKAKLPVQKLNFLPSVSHIVRPVATKAGGAQPAAARVGAAGKAAKKPDYLSGLTLATAPRVDTAVLKQLRQISLQGRNWMFTPYRPITLVHAVQQPLLVPVLQVKANKSLGQTYATLYGQMTVDGKSTDKVDISAEWDEPIDPLSETKWRTIPGAAHVFEKPVDRADTIAKYERRQHNFGDTKYRKVRYSPVATTRYREYFPRALTNDPKNISRTGEKVEVDILNSARPSAPHILYVIPTFGWEAPKRDSSGVSRKRSGGGLRVYLDRPWFSSGEGELLGVVMAPGESSANVMMAVNAAAFAPAKVRPYVTQWGLDPIWASPATYSAPLPEHFKRAAATGKNLSLAELPASEAENGPKVWVVGHGVEYDEERQLWYCDIEIDAGPSYYPFVRLALARYQPKSVDNAHLSTVVIADFAQLAPDRFANVTFTSETSLRVSLSGVYYTASGVGQGPSEVEVVVETQRAGFEGDLAWIPVSGDAFQLKQGNAARGGIGISRAGLEWSGEVTLPGPRSAKKYRLVIKEYEKFYGDDETLVAATVAGFVPKTERRLVYVDTLEI